MIIVDQPTEIAKLVQTIHQDFEEVIDETLRIKTVGVRFLALAHPRWEEHAGAS
jgi:hypothetical protein